MSAVCTESASLVAKKRVHANPIENNAKAPPYLTVLTPQASCLFVRGQQGAHTLKPSNSTGSCMRGETRHILSCWHSPRSEYRPKYLEHDKADLTRLKPRFRTCYNDGPKSTYNTSVEEVIRYSDYLSSVLH